jgi:triphosphoribosyl-dephospho-CoA synthetase
MRISAAAETRRAVPAKPVPLQDPDLRIRPAILARNIAHGAMFQLRLTPKPGLVDLRDNGSHSDLSFVLMARSASLLPAYFRELQEAQRCRGLSACIEAGRRAEDRMLATVGSNTHRGYIFLGGLFLLASAGEVDGIGEFRLRIMAAAEDFFATVDSVPDLRDRRHGESHGARVRREHSLGGIRAEALAGLPSVFEVGLPALASFHQDSGDFGLASLYAFSRLMQVVEDTTAVHRCGLEGLARIRHDGTRLQRVIEEGGDHLVLLEQWNEEYRSMRLTMGGVGDCLSLTYAVYLTAAGLSEAATVDLQSQLLSTRHRSAGQLQRSQ